MIDLNDTVALPSRAVLEVSGADALGFLQNLVTQDLERLGDGQAVYSALLTAQGKFLHDFHIARLGDALLLDPEAARLPDLQRRLTLYRLRAQVVLRPRPDLAAVALPGRRLDAPLRVGTEGLIFPDARLPGLGARGFVPAAGLPASDPADYDRLRLRLGMPDGSRDIEVERMALLESNLDELNAIGWGKGCYVGQELTARTRHRGLVSKRLLPVEAADPAAILPAVGTALLLDGEPVGEMRGSVPGIGLAQLRLDRAPHLPGSGRIVMAEELPLTVLKPDWLPDALLQPVA